MAEAIFRIPSRTVQYGYVEISVPAAPDASPEFLAAHYVNYVYAFQKEEEAAVERIKKGVSAPQSYWEATAEEHAQALLDEGLGGVTEVPEPEGDALYNEAAKPWDQKVDARKKPWEDMDTAPAPALDDVW